MSTIFVVSDATGDTAERMARSALVQFKDAAVQLVRRGHVDTPDAVRAVLREAAGKDSLVVHTLVSDELRRLMLTEPLLALPPERVFCLSLQPEQLRQRRHARATIEAIPLEPYASLAQVSKEYAYAERLCKQRGWRRIDVTGNSVEEVARTIITLLADHGARSS